MQYNFEFQEENPFIDQLTKRNIKCYQHNEPLSYLDLSRVCQDRSRLKCIYCKQNENCVSIIQFNELCEQFSKTSKNANDQIIKDYLKLYQNIQNTLNQMNEKIQKTLFSSRLNKNFIQYLEQYLQFVNQFNENIGTQYNQYCQFKSMKSIGLQEFEFLTQSISEQVDFQEFDKKLIVKKQAFDDQKQAESNQYLDSIQQLNQMITNFVTQNNLCNIQNLNNNQLNNNLKDLLIEQVKPNETDDIQIFNQEGQILSSNQKLPIADIQLNFDQTILAARLCEPFVNILFWKQDSIHKKWNKYQTLECYQKSLVYFTLSKLQNILITSGSDLNNGGKIKIWVLNEEWWIIKQIFVPQNHSGLGKQRISCIIFNPSETEIIYSEGARVAVLCQKQQIFEIKYSVQKSSEIITNLGISNDGKILAVGGCDQKVTLWKFDDTKLIQFQQLKLYNTPKSIIFSSNNQDLIICTKDGLVHCFTNKHQKQKEYYETQKIFNNIAKIRNIKFNHDSSILAIGGETNVLQLWKKDPQNEWKCQNEYKQDMFIESICFSKTQEYIYASNNNEIYIHQLF